MLTLVVRTGLVLVCGISGTPNALSLVYTLYEA